MPNNEEFEDRMENLFSDTPEPEKVEEVVTKEVVTEEETPEEVVAEVEEGEIDYDAVDAPPVLEEDDEIQTESAARQQAKIRGKEAKELRVTLTERELELERERTEKADLKARLEEIEATKVAPEDHEDYRLGRDSILADVRGAARRLTGDAKTLLPNVFGKLMGQYLASSDVAPENVVEEDEKLAGQIISTLKLSDIPYAELDTDERAALQPAVDKVLDVLERNAGKTKDLQKLHTSLSEKAKTGQLSVGVRQYETTSKEFGSVLDTVGELADDLIEANPHAVSSVVAKLAKTPEGKKRLEAARKDVLEVIVGPRALTQSEIDKMEGRGENVKEFIAERNKAHRAKQLKLSAMFTEGLMTRALLKEALTKLAKYEDKADGEESEMDAIRKVAKKKASPAKAEKKAWSIDNLFADN